MFRDAEPQQSGQRNTERRKREKISRDFPHHALQTGHGKQVDGVYHFAAGRMGDGNAHRVERP
jgi:hypothetical protein